MGNRAIITTKEGYQNNGAGIYLHWNGGRDSVEGFLLYAKLQGCRGGDYGLARMTQYIGNWFGGTLSLMMILTLSTVRKSAKGLPNNRNTTFTK